MPPRAVRDRLRTRVWQRPGGGQWRWMRSSTASRALVSAAVCRTSAIHGPPSCSPPPTRRRTGSPSRCRSARSRTTRISPASTTATSATSPLRPDAGQHRQPLSVYAFDPMRLKIVVVAHGPGLKFFLEDFSGAPWQSRRSTRTFARALSHGVSYLTTARPEELRTPRRGRATSTQLPGRPRGPDVGALAPAAPRPRLTSPGRSPPSCTSGSSARAAPPCRPVPGTDIRP